MFLLMFKNKLNMAPIKDNVGNVLDVGTGTGLWAIDFGTTFIHTTSFECILLTNCTTY